MKGVKAFVQHVSVTLATLTTPFCIRIYRPHHGYHNLYFLLDSWCVGVGSFGIKRISLSDGRVDGMRIAQRLAKHIGPDVYFDDLDT